VFDAAWRTLMQAIKITFGLFYYTFRLLTHLSVNPTARAAALRLLLVLGVVAGGVALLSGAGRAGQWLVGGLAAGAPEAIAALVLLLAAAGGAVALLARRSPAVQARLAARRARQAQAANPTTPAPAGPAPAAPPPPNPADQIEWGDAPPSPADTIEFLE
jgi:hypothetical protein